MIDLWIRLARRWLKLPEGNPTIPAGDPGSVKVWNPAEGYLRYTLLGFWVGARSVAGSNDAGPAAEHEFV